MKYLSLLILIAIFKIGYSQTDTSKRNVVQIIDKTNSGVYNYCYLKKNKNRVYQEEIGHSFHRTVLATGWFKLEGTCPREIYDLPIVECKFNLAEKDLYVRYKRGRLYSGRINDKDEKYRIKGCCRKGLLHGNVKILDNERNIIWEGKMKNGVLIDQ